jgi:hypothetical protein
MKHFRNLQRLIALAVMLAAPLAAVAGTNFRVVNLPPEQGADYGRAADEAYSRLSRWWFGKRLPDLWRPGQLAPVPITVHLQPQGSGGGRTSFRIEGGHVFGWKMTVAGSPQKILDDAIPHEVGHVVFYARFRRPLGRCLDEGTAGIGESSREHAAARQRVADALRHKAVLPFSRILDEQRYPQPSATLLFYAQSHSLVEFLLQRKGRERFVAFLDDPRSPSVKLREFYGINSEQLQDAWEAWFRERSVSGLTCERFGCPVHACAKPQAGNRKPVVYAFTAGWCSACKPFQRDVAAGRFPAYRFVFVDPDADGKRWNEITAKMAAETGHRGGVPLPSWWVPGSKRLAVMRNGYSASGLLQILRGLIRGLLRLLDNPHLSPDGTPQGTRPRGDGTPVPSGPAGDAATATTPSLTRKDLKAELLTFGRQFVRKEVKAAIVAKITGGEPPDPLRDLKQEIVFWLASIGLPLWLVERITKHRRLATQVHKAWQRLRSSSPSSPPSAASAEPPASSSAPSPASGSDSTSSG